MGLPPSPSTTVFGIQLEDCKMQVRGARIGIPRRSHKTDDIPALDTTALPQTLLRTGPGARSSSNNSCFVELVDGSASRFAEQQFANAS
jgi:hypothetical protein